LKYVISNKNPEAQILSTLLLKQVSCNKNVSAIHVQNEIAQCLFAWHMSDVIEGVINVNADAGVNQVKTDSSKSISRLERPHFFVVANNNAHEWQKRT